MSKFIFVQGFNASGTSAIWDILKSSNNILIFPGEFHYYRLNEGIASLKFDLFEKYSTYVERDYAVKKFIKAFKNYNFIHFYRYKLSLKKNTNWNDLNQLVVDFINSIKLNGFYGSSFYSLLFKSKSMIFLFKLKRYIQIHLFSDKHQNVKGDFYNIYTYDEIDFDAKIKTFIIGIIQVLTKHRIEDYDYMMLSHFFSNINNFNEFNGILGLNKMIVIYRDPRDVFATLINRDSSWSGVSEKNSIEENIENFKIYYKHNNISNLNDLSKDILIVKFERLIHNYEIERGRIFKFLNILSGFSDSVFSPNDSIKNIGIYKNIEPVYKELFDYLIREYPEHCEK